MSSSLHNDELITSFIVEFLFIMNDETILKKKSLRLLLDG